MREIKFRAWDKQRKKMLAPDEGLRLNYQSVVGYAETIANDWGITARGDFFFRELRGMTFPKNDFVLMQFTGLTDRNGVEIYEGDIIDYFGKTDAMHVGTVTRVVEWNDDRCGFSPMYWWYSQEGRDLLEVIGNIYENPELLEKSND